MCVEIEREKKIADNPQQTKTTDEIPSQDELDRAGQHYLRLVDKRMKHFKKMSYEERIRFKESIIQVRDGSDERLDHFSILIERRKVQLADLEIEE